MCGIAGVINFHKRPKIEECISDMFESMKKRGPDASGITISENSILFHTRLVIIDAENGKQPMKLSRNGEIYTIVYNGELYNTKELRQTLISHGETFIGYSDTEVLLHAYVYWGPACLEKLNGIFAFAVLHEKEQRLFFARDRMGVKPFFFCLLEDDTFVFASEIKTLLHYPRINPVIDADGLSELLFIGPGRTPGCGVFKGIKELKPGECGSFDTASLKTEKYWYLKDREHTDSISETTAYVRYLITDSIKRQLVSDVPVGTFLSGGLDSSIISSIAASEFKKNGIRLPTFTVTYKNNDKNFQSTSFQPSSDDEYVETMVKWLDSDHHTITINNEELIAALYAAVDARDLPGMADIDSSLLLFCREIKQHVSVALSGECADEIFGGYPWYRDKKIRQSYGFPWAQSTSLRSSIISDSLIKRLPDDFSGAGEIDKRYKAALSQVDKLPGLSEQERRLREMVHLNTYWFMQTLLDRKDRMSMNSGLEVRVPFCDHRIAEYMYSVPWEYKELDGMEKGLLRHAVSGLLPDEIRLRKKSPYPKTHDPEYKRLVSSLLSNIMQNTDAPILTLFKRDALESLITNDFATPWYGQLMTGPQTIAYIIQLNYWLEKYDVKISL